MLPAGEATEFLTAAKSLGLPAVLAFGAGTVGGFAWSKRVFIGLAIGCVAALATVLIVGAK